MQIVSLHDKDEIHQFLKQNVYLHIYSIGDLDDFFWPHTVWFGSRVGSELQAIALLYVGMSLPTLLALSEDLGEMRELLESIQHLLPSRLYAHLSPGLETFFDEKYCVGPHGEHYKMALKGMDIVNEVDCSNVEPLGKANESEMLTFYEACYPGNWFDPRMLETNQYFGIREEGRLVSVAGIHVYSPEYRVASLGNIATHRAYRGRGYARKVTAQVCRSLSSNHVDHIGLNVKADNNAAISCYRGLGFEAIGSYGEFMLDTR